MSRNTSKKTKKKEESKKTDKGEKKSDEETHENGEPEEEDEEEEVPFERKVAFTEKVRRLTNEGLTKLVKKVKELCPDALEDVDTEKLHIKVDQIDMTNFSALELLVDENLNKSTKDKPEASSKKAKKTSE